MELRLPTTHFSSPLLGSYSLPSLAEGSEAISEAEEIHEVKSLQEKGNKAARAKDNSKALRYFSEALDIDQGNVGVLHDRSLVLLQMGRYNEARVDAEAVIMMSPGYSQGHHVLGLCLQQLNQNKEALISFLTALDLDLDDADRLTNHIASVASHLCDMPTEFRKSLKGMDAYKKLSEVGVCLFQSKKFDLCIRILEAAQKFQTNQKGITMKILLTMANAHTSLRQRDQAIGLYLECLSMAVATHDQLYQTKSLVNVATLYLENGDTYQAIIYYEKLLHLKAELLTEVGHCENLPDFWTKELQCGLHLNLSIAYKSIGNMHSAVYHAQKYNGFMKEFGFSGRTLAESHHNTGMLSEILGNYQEALEQYQLYMNLSKKNGNRKGIAQAYGCMGTVYAALRNWTLSITYHEQYIKMAAKFGDKRMLAIANEMLADSYMLKEDYDSAVKHYEAMLKACARTDSRTKSTGLCKLGNAYRAQSKKQYSLYFYEQAYDIAKDYGYTDIQTMAEYNIACIQQASTQMQDIEQALKYFLKLIPFYETKIREHVDEGTHRPAGYDEQLLECYDGVQSVLSKLGNKEECLQFAEGYRKRTITQLPNFTSTLGQTIPSTLALRDVWTVERMNRAVSQQNGTVMYYSLLDSSLLLWVLQPARGLVRFYSGRAGKDMSMRDQIQSLIDEVLSEYDKENLVNECENKSLPLPDADLKNVRRTNMKLAKKSPTSDTTDTSQTLENDNFTPKAKKSAQRQLYNILFAPVEDILSSLDTMSHLLIVPDKELCHCPFGILQDWNARYVMDRFRITFLPCLLLLDKVLRNEMDHLRHQDQLEFDRSQCRKGGTNKVMAMQKRESLFSEIITPSDLSMSSLERVNLKHVSNPRLYTSGVLRTPDKGRNSQVALSREATFQSQLSRADSKRGEAGPGGVSSGLAQAVGRPVSPEKMLSTQTYTTLTTRTSTETDITTSSQMVTLYQQISSKERCVVYGCPEILDSVELRGQPWRPRCDLDNMTKALHKVAECLDVNPVVSTEATKHSLLQDLQKATIVHIATFGCWRENLLVLTPNKDRLEGGVATERSYIVSPEDIHNLKMCAQLVVLNCGYNPWRREYIHSFSLPASFLAAGAQCVMVTQWQVPDNAMDKFYHHFYMSLQNGCLLSDAVRTGMEAVRHDNRFTHVYNWCPFILIGKDTEVSINQIRHAMLDQKLDHTEATVEEETGQEYLNPRNVVAHVPTKEENFESLQRHVVDILRHHQHQPGVIPGLIDLLDAALKRLHTEDNNKQTSQLSAELTKGEGSVSLLTMLGFHFQAMGASLSEPYIVYPHWNKDEMLIPAYDALRALTDIVGSAECSQNLCDILPLQQDHISLLVDLMSITRHAPELQLKVTDLSVRPLWQNTKVKKLLMSAGFHQIGLLLNFNKVPVNGQLLTSLLQLLLAVSCHKSQVLLYRLDVNLLGRSPSPRQNHYSGLDNIKLPSLTPLILPRNQLRMSTPWHSTVEREEEMTQKMRLARSKSNLDEDFQDYLERARTWHQMTVTAQKELANEALKEVGRPKTSPTKVKVIAGGSASRERIPITQEEMLMIPEVDQRRDYAHFVLQQRVDNIDLRHKDEVMKLYLPYIQS
ncbi:tetratricopeptide repeat protein 28-like [Haliotis rufescens]|uniref:tetratricopeptide repeat protein 28-like n=1 Tax=Haliotis rufescens TaxID=6454 RepID=UPI00201F11F6|nr:tetratricopeptide repeat protein 28-like [Haliotis rufescens]